MGRRLVLAAAQLGPASSDKEANARTACRLIEEAGKRGATIVALPELALTKYFCVQNFREYESFFEGEHSALLTSISDAAREFGVSCILPYAEKGGIAYYNSAVVIDSRGRTVGRYRKIHIPGSFPEDSGAITFERLYFTPGDLGFPVFEVGGLRIGIQICHDRNFPEGFRILALLGAEIIFVPTNMPAWGRTWTTESWELMLRTRALENGLFIVGIGKAGLEDGTQFVGDSLVISPLAGHVLARACLPHEELVIAEIDLDEVTESRRRLPWMRDRRPDQYGRLSQ